MREIKRVCVFCGSSPGAHPEYREAARGLGELLAREKLGLVYGGGNVGLMGVVADAALAAGGEVIGVIPRHLEAKELAHRGVTELHVVETMHERKALMADRCDAFIAMPGGMGTLEELFEAATWSQLGIHDKPLGLLNVRGYFDALDHFLQRAVADRFLAEHHRALLMIHADAAALLHALRTFDPPRMDKWLDRFER